MKNIPHNKKHIIQLSAKQRTQLHHITNKGNHNARVIKRATILLKSDRGLKDEDIIKHVGGDKRTVERIRKKFVEHDLNTALYDAPRSGKPPTLDNKAEAHLVAYACSDPPEGSERWTLQLLKERLLSDKIVVHISCQAISDFGRQALNQRIPTAHLLREICKTYEQRRNTQKATIRWKFTKQDAQRIFKYDTDDTRQN